MNIEGLGEKTVKFLENKKEVKKEKNFLQLVEQVFTIQKRNQKEMPEEMLLGEKQGTVVP